MAKKKRIKTLTAGRFVAGVCYTQALASDSPKARAAKTKCSNLARLRMNFRAAWQKIRLLLCANFGRYDLWVTVGYDDAHLPQNRREAKKCMTKFIDRLRASRKKSGVVLKYMYNTEELQDSRTRRLHHHIVINASPDRVDFDLIRSLWDGGDNIEIRYLGAHELYSDDFIELAQYMAKERNPDAALYATGDKAWVPSRNLTRPVPDSYMVDENVTITAPPGAVILDKAHTENEYGVFDYICYMLPERPAEKLRSPRRKKE